MAQADRNSRVAVVTGASSGMGKDIAQRLLELGFTVYVAARRVDAMADLASSGAHPIKLDISREADIAGLAEQILNEVGGVDVLVNNAGFGLYGAVEDVGIDEARYQFEVNLFGLARLTQLLLPSMRAKGTGTIINISSIGGKIYTPLGAWYHATKHALEGWSDCLRIELAQHGIDVVIIEPGLIETEFGNAVGSPVLERSGQGAYAGMARAMSATVEASYRDGAGSPPSVISDLVARIVSTRRPRTRYAAGKMATPLLLARRWLSDRLFDRVILSQVR